MSDEKFKYFLNTIPEAFKQRLMEDKALSKLTDMLGNNFSTREPLLTIDEAGRYHALAPDVFDEEMANADYTFMHLSYPCSLKYTKALCEIAPEIAKRTMLQKDINGNLPLHSSILCSKSDVWITDRHQDPECNKTVFIDKLNLFAKHAKNEFAQALTVKNNEGQNPLHILLQHSYEVIEKTSGFTYHRGKDTSTTIKQALELMNWFAKDELKYALSSVDNKGDLPHFGKICELTLVEDLITLIRIAPDEAVNMLLQKPSDSDELNIHNIDKEYEHEIIDALKEYAPEIFRKLCYINNKQGRPILCRYVDEKNVPMLEAIQECVGADRFFDAINRPYNDRYTIAQKIMAL